MAKSQASQNFIPVKEVRDGIVVLKNGEMRSILLVSALNMALKSGDEQEAVILQFQNFLNSLEFSVQIVVQSRRLDIRPYLVTLEERLGVQEEELLRVQTREYIEFIKWFTSSVNIMSKNFYVVIPYAGTVLANPSGGGIFGSIANIISPPKGTKGAKAGLAAFEESRAQIEQRISVIRSGLSHLGLRIEQLDTDAVIEVFYTMFNPGETERNIPELER